MPQIVKAYGQEIEFPDDMPPDQIAAVIRKNAMTLSAASGKEKKSSNLLGDLAAGAVRGAGSIGATLMMPVDAAARAAGISNDYIGRSDRRSAMDRALSDMGADTDSVAFGVGKIGGEIAGTAGIGGALAGGLRAIPMVARSGAAAPLIDAIASGGFKAGGMSGLPSLAVRATGGAVSGAASAGLVNPDDAAMGAAVGAAMPVAIQAVGKVGGAIGKAYRTATMPEKARIAQSLAQTVGRPVQEVIAALEQQGPEMLPGYQKTVPQILQTPGVSQLQRTVKTAGATAIGDAEHIQQQAMRDALNRVAPADVTVNDSANRAGAAIQSYYADARKAASDRVSRAFAGVDPFNETSLNLPVREMQASAQKYLGPGTFGAGPDVERALKTAEGLSTDVLDAVIPAKLRAGQDVAKAVRASGGIRGVGGELRDLGIKQSGTTGLINNRSGKSLDMMAEEMAQRGFIKNADPDELLSALSDSVGKRGSSYGFDTPEDVMRSVYERGMGDAPEAIALQKGVPFQTMQNLRSSIGDAAERAGKAGSNQERAALRGMVSAIDDKIKMVSEGASGGGEYFPKDVADQYRTALKMHADKVKQFDTGPQYMIGRKGADGLPALQGAEIPGKFFSGRASQVEDVRAFKELIKDKPALADELKRFAVTEASSTGNMQGDLTTKYLRWLESRSGAARELFTPGELATLKEVGKAVERQSTAENLGRVVGPDTAQKLKSMQSLGLLDSPVVDTLAHRIPFVGSFTGPALNALRGSAAREKTNLIAGLLADPAEMASALRRANAGGSSAVDDVLNSILPLTYRAAPVSLLGLAGQ